jgi:Flp pilus assembly protein TadG
MRLDPWDRRFRLSSVRGQTLVEFALVALLLVMLLVGIVDVSRLILTYTTIANAARAGTRYAIVHGSDNSGTCNVTNYIEGYLSAASMNTASPPLTITAPACGSSAGTTITTTVSYNYTPLITYFWPTSITLTSTSEGVVVF